MRKGNRRADQSDAFFPFLAVLLCSVGAAIVLLLVMVLQTKASATQLALARQTKSEQEAASVEQVRQTIEDARWRIEMLESSREKTAEQLDLKRRELSHLEDEIRRIREQLDLAAAEAEQIEKAAGGEASEVDAARDRLKALQAELEKAKEALELARKDRANDRPSYAIVPYDGPNGTRRQPIYVECLDDKVIFQPEGLELTAEDFEEPMTDDNPLAAALRAKREYVKDVTGESESLAYPLLIVRPTGAHSYAAARAAMKSWETEFGYELVEDELPLAYPEKDEALREVMQLAVDEARARRRYLKLIAPARFGRREAPPLLTASSGGGFVTPDGQSSGRAMRRRGGAAVGDGTGSSGTGRGLASSDARMPSGAPGGHGGIDARTPGTGGSLGVADGSWDGASGNYSAEDSPTGSARTSGSRGRGRGNDGGDSTSRGAGDSSQEPNGKSGATGEKGGAGNDRNADGTEGSAEGNGNGRNGARGGRSSGDGTQGANGADGSMDDNALRGPANGRNGSASGQGNGRSNSRGGKAGGSGESRLAGGGAAGTQNGGSSANGSSSGNGGGAAGGNAGGGASGGGAAGASGGGAVSMGMGSPGASSAAAAAGRRARGGGNWGLPETSVGQTGITRPISVECSADQVILLPEKRSRTQPMVLEVNGLLSEQIDEFVAKVWQRMDSWGTAGENMYWKPVLQVKVGENGESMYRELERLLQDSGIDVVRK